MKDKLIRLMQNEKLTLISTHERLCFPIIERIAKKMSIGLMFSSISVDENLIVNGHHRYLASLLVGYNLDQVPCPKTTAKEPVDWKLVKLVDDDWDTDAKIRMLNEQDARYNDLTLDDLMKKLR
ncbi:MAG: hypothetical protein ACKVOQ_08830 [Cyclobacteriaceae bacterium]